MESVAMEASFRVDLRRIVHVVYDQIGRYHYHCARSHNRDVYPMVTIGEAYSWNDYKSIQSDKYTPRCWNECKDNWLCTIERDTTATYNCARDRLLNNVDNDVLIEECVDSADDVEAVSIGPAVQTNVRAFAMYASADWDWDISNEYHAAHNDWSSAGRTVSYRFTNAAHARTPGCLSSSKMPSSISAASPPSSTQEVRRT